MSLFPELGPGTYAIGDELDRCFTPLSLADACARRVAEILDAVPRWTPRYIIEPSAGGGSFVRAARKVWPGTAVTGIDLDPAAPARTLCSTWIHGDFLQQRFTEPGALVIGNPPFSGDVALPHMLAAREVPEAAVALILPWSYLGGVERWGVLHREHTPDIALPITPRPWGDKVREVALYVWLAGRRPAGTHIGAPIVGWK